jgi:hypothetical protein
MNQETSTLALALAGEAVFALALVGDVGSSDVDSGVGEGDGDDVLAAAMAITMQEWRSKREYKQFGGARTRSISETGTWAAGETGARTAVDETRMWVVGKTRTRMVGEREEDVK